MNRTLFYFDKSSIAKACDKVKKFCKDGLLEAPDCNVYQVPGDVGSKKSALFVDSNKSVFIDYINRIIRAYDWRAEGIEGFEEARGTIPEDEPDEAADPMAEFYKLNPGVKPLGNNSSIEIKFLILDKVTEEEAVRLGSLGLRQVGSNPESIFELDRKVREDLCLHQEEVLSGIAKERSEKSASKSIYPGFSSWPFRNNTLGIKPSKFEAAKPPADFGSGAAELALRLAIEAEQDSLKSNNMYEILENAKQVYDFLKGTSSHFVNGKSLGGAHDKP
jgi:hypothetical protein